MLNYYECAERLQKATERETAIEIALEKRSAELENLKKEYRTKAREKALTPELEKMLSEQIETAQTSKDRARADLIPAKLRRSYWSDNARYTKIAELMKDAAEVLKEFDGRKYGEKTRERISERFQERTGFYMFLKPHDIIFRNYTTGDPFCYSNLECGTYAADLLPDNRINAAALEMFTPTATYTENPGEAAQRTLALFEKAKRLEKEFSDAVDEYNATRPRIAQCISRFNYLPSTMGVSV